MSVFLASDEWLEGQSLLAQPSHCLATSDRGWHPGTEQYGDELGLRLAFKHTNVCTSLASRAVP